MTTGFFDEAQEQSIVKATIVSKYFWSWAKIIIGSQKRYKKGDRLAYIDLFAGPGRYDDGQSSTPLRILETTINDTELREWLVTIFNDKDSNHTQSLESEIKKLANVDLLKYQPKVYNEEVGDRIVNMFEEMNLVPTLFFVDPWGYKGLSLRLINSVLKNWGCDCIFFFNYNRINMGLGNKFIADHINALFGQERANNLREELRSITTPQEREMAVIEEISQSLQSMGGEYVLPFRFKNAQGSRTSHHLIFVSKHVLGYSIMKDIMARESSNTEQGVPTFEYNPASQMFPLLFELVRPLDDLADMLLTEMAGQRLTMNEIFEKHHIGKRYVKKNYKEILKKLESEGKICCDPPIEKRRKNTFADTVKVTFHNN